MVTCRNVVPRVQYIFRYWFPFESIEPPLQHIPHTENINDGFLRFNFPIAKPHDRFFTPSDTCLQLFLCERMRHPTRGKSAFNNIPWGRDCWIKKYVFDNGFSDEPCSSVSGTAVRNIWRDYVEWVSVLFLAQYV